MNGQDTSSQWNSAAFDGLILASVTVVMTLLSSAAVLVSMLCWMAKLCLSIYLLCLFMKRFAGSSEGSVFGYGVKVCLFSSIVCAAFSYVLYRYISPEALVEAVSKTKDIFSSGNMSPEYQDALNLLEDDGPRLICISTLIWDFILGLIFSGIISTFVSAPGKKQFDNEQDES